VSFVKIAPKLIRMCWCYPPSRNKIKKRNKSFFYI